jgi:hypothetical protein
MCISIAPARLINGLGPETRQIGKTYLVALVVSPPDDQPLSIALIARCPDRRPLHFDDDNVCDEVRVSANSLECPGMRWSSVSGIGLFLLVLSGIPCLVPAAEPAMDPWYSDADIAWQRTKLTNRPLLLLATTDGCLYCDQMKHDTLTNRAVLNELQQSFILATAKDSDKPTLIRKLQITTFPTTVIISPQGRVLDKIEGYLPPQKFHTRLLSTARLSALPPAASR